MKKVSLNQIIIENGVPDFYIINGSKYSWEDVDVNVFDLNKEIYLHTEDGFISDDGTFRFVRTMSIYYVETDSIKIEVVYNCQ